MKKARKKAPRIAPQRWSEPTLSLQQRILSQYQYDPIGQMLLSNLLDAYERMLGAGRILAREGTIVVDRFGQQKPHPAFEQESASRLSVLRHARALGVDISDISESEDSDESAISVR